MDSEIETVDTLKAHINEGNSFLLQGGAGSGKTETLKILLDMLVKDYPDKKVVCITHTNAAVDEIRSRTGSTYEVFTIHSFLQDLIHNYQVNIKQTFPCIFTLEQFEYIPKGEMQSETEYKKSEHDRYKKIYEKYSDMNFKIRQRKSDKLVGKREYDKSSKKYNDELNLHIDELNSEIIRLFNEKADDGVSVEYSKSGYDSFYNLTYGHDGLIKIATKMILEFPLLVKIIRDKYDLILIDEYQDSNVDVIRSFMEIIRSETTIIGLFGDEMQAIYPDGVGQVTKYIEQGILKFVPKKDNYRCSYPVVALLNTLRFDGINQRVALKKGENIGERQGSVNLFYYVYDRKPSLYSRNRDEKVEYLKIIDSVINYVIDIPEFKNNAYKKLMLSNRAVAKKLKFDGLYDVFASRYSEVKDEMEKACANLMWLDLVELCFCYELGKHSLVVEKLQKNGYRVSDYTSKQKICDSLEYILNNNLSIKNAMEYAIKNKLIAESESRESYIFRTKEFLKMISIDVCFLKFQQEYAQYNTAARMRSAEIIIDDEDFLEQEKNLKKVLFYQRLLSNEISFNQIKNYYTYLNDETEYVTMHKTKGTGIENVLVVVEEYFWASRYNFNLVFTNQEGTLRKSSQKLFYVACSRTKKNLGILRVIVPEEEASLRELFKMCHITKIDEKSISCSLISKGGEET